jgi:phosphate transport system protein
MPSFSFLRGERGDRIDAIEAKVRRMLELDRLEFDLAMSALMGDVEARSVNDELRSTDQKVNQAEREIRRELVVHASVFGAIEIPTVLVYMSIVKDVERVGDYAKNIIDVALDGVTFAETDDAEEWRDLAREISTFISEAADAFQARNSERSRTLLTQGDRMLDSFDMKVSALVKGDDQGTQAVARALVLRYLKRVVAHLLNILTAVVMPIHRLDYFDEDPEDRG